MSSLSFEITDRDASSGARAGRVTTLHGSFATPAFMPVGTQGSIKGLLPGLVRDIGAQIVLANTYHLMLRPGSELVAKMGGLQQWTGWQGPILTDSGGFQVFSLADINTINDDGVVFQSHIDGQTVHLTPELSMSVQNDLGADIIMAFDDCPPAAEGGGGPRPGAEDEDGDDAGSAAGTAGRPLVKSEDYAARVQLACERSLRWLERCVAAHRRADEQALFAIVQGGTDLDRRTWCAQGVVQHDLPGYAIGGVAVGEGYEALKAVVEHTAPLLPADRPRYLMGVGYERDIVTAVRAGVDMFDCVLPTRNGRSGNAFTRTGQIRLKNAKFRDDPQPIEAGCDCPACGGTDSGVHGPESSDPGPRTLDPGLPHSGPFSRSYLRHMFLSGEMLGPILVSLHNLRHFQRLLLDIRGAIADNDWSAFARSWPVAMQG